MPDEQEIGSKRADQIAEGEEPVEGEQKEPRSGDGEETSGWLSRVSGALPRWTLRKPFLIVMAGLFLGGAGAWGFLASSAGRWAAPVKSSSSGEPEASDGLRQENLPRFYVPLPKGGPVSVLVIEWAVVWDGLSAVRYRNTEVTTRDRIYDALTSLAARQEGLNENLPVLEETMGAALKNSLRNESVSVRVKEVRTY